MKLPPFIQRNKILTVLFLFAFLASIYLIITVVMEYGSIQDFLTRINEKNGELAKINSNRNPSPVKENAKLINDDTKILKERTLNIKRSMGKPYRKALLVFLDTLSSRPAAANGAAAGDKDPFQGKLQLTESDIHTKFADFCRSPEAGAAPDLRRSSGSKYDEYCKKLFTGFRAKLIEAPVGMNGEEKEAFEKKAGELFDLALKKFTEEVQKGTAEKLVGSDGRAAARIFLTALGLRRYSSSVDCYMFISQVSPLIARKIPGQNLRKQTGKDAISEDDLIRRVIYDKYGKQPNQDNVDTVYVCFQIIEDMISRINKSKIRELVRVDYDSSRSRWRRVDLKGENANFYTYFFKIELRSTLPQIRTLLNSFHDAIDDNRMYVITSIKLKSVQGMEERYWHATDKYKSNSRRDDRDDYYSDGRNMNGRNMDGRNMDGRNMDGRNMDGRNMDELNMDGRSARRNTRQDDYAGPMIDPNSEDYGKLVLGGADELITANIELEFWMYNGDDVTPQTAR